MLSFVLFVRSADRTILSMFFYFIFLKEKSVGSIFYYQNVFDKLVVLLPLLQGKLVSNFLNVLDDHIDDV
jgi:hypothetical protein